MTLQIGRAGRSRLSRRGLKNAKQPKNAAGPVSPPLPVSATVLFGDLPHGSSLRPDPSVDKQRSGDEARLSAVSTRKRRPRAFGLRRRRQPGWLDPVLT